MLQGGLEAPPRHPPNSGGSGFNPAVVDGGTAHLIHTALPSIT